MEKFLIIGGKRLNGEVKIDCAKNSLLPLLACSIMVDGEVRLECVPKYSDVLAMCDIIVHLGGKTKWEGDDLIIDARNMQNVDVPNELASCVRSSIFMLGPILGKMKKRL